MNKKGELQLRKLKPENLESLIETYEECFSISVDKAYFQWKYYDNPSGEAVCFIALDGQKVGAFYGVIPEIYELNGEKIKVYQSMDTMTHPNYRRQGLFTRLANITYQHILDTEGRLILVGIPGGNSYHGFVNKLGWKDINQTSYVFLQKNAFKLKNAFTKRSKLNIDTVLSITPEIKSYLTKRPPSRKPIRPHLSPEFFDWRVFKNPNRKTYRDYKVAQILDNNDSIIGICVYILDNKNRCYIELLDFNNSTHYSEHSKTVMEFLFEETNTNFIYTWELQDDAIGRSYKKIGFIKNRIGKGLFSYRIPVIIRAEPSRINGVDLYNISNFDIQPLMQD